MSVETLVDVLLTVAAITAIGGGVGCATSPAWAAVVVGVVVLGIVVVARTGRKPE
jgi:hypothetical protein